MGNNSFGKHLSRPKKKFKKPLDVLFGGWNPGGLPGVWKAIATTELPSQLIFSSDHLRKVGSCFSQVISQIDILGRTNTGDSLTNLGGE